jgi:hypothetical protein
MNIQKFINVFRRKRATVLVGAGAAIEIGGASTGRITNEIRQKVQSVVNPANIATSISRSFIDEIANALNSYFGNPPGCHFEDIFHTLEVLDSCVHAGSASTGKQFKPHFFPFFTANPQNWLDRYAIMAAKRDLLETISNLVAQYDAAFAPYGQHRWYANFWRTLYNAIPLDIGTLNYDRTIETSLSGLRYEDGYGTVATNPLRFNPKRVLRTSRSLLLHLHGCTLYGYSPPTNTNSFEDMYEDYFEDIFKYPDEVSARRTWFGRSNPNAQSGESIIGGPIITGLRKTDKLLAYPYTTYNQAFANSLLRNPYLLIVGYSFGDFHINALLGKMASIHGPRRRIVIVSYINDPQNNWHPDFSVCDWASDQMVRFLFRAFRQEPIANNLTFLNPLISNDGCVRLYLEGTRNAFESHGNEIVRFLST